MKEVNLKVVDIADGKIYFERNSLELSCGQRSELVKPLNLKKGDEVKLVLTKVPGKKPAVKKQVKKPVKKTTKKKPAKKRR